MRLLLFIAALLLAFVGADEKPYVIIKTEEASNTTPRNFIEGLPQYVTLYQDKHLQDQYEDQFLLCTSCTISYMFGNTTGGTVENIVFREHPDQSIPVTFKSKDFYFRKDPSVYTDPADRSFKVTHRHKFQKTYHE